MEARKSFRTWQSIDGAPVDAKLLISVLTLERQIPLIPAEAEEMNPLAREEVEIASAVAALLACALLHFLIESFTSDMGCYTDKDVSANDVVNMLADFPIKA